MTRDEILQLCDDVYNSYENEIHTRQNAFYNENGFYFQGLSTHSVMPRDGNQTAPDFPAVPSDLPVPYPADAFPAVMPCAMRIDAYNTSLGAGYSIILLVEIADHVNMKRLDYGNTIQQSFDWMEVT